MVHYPWHPLYGQSVLVRRGVRGNSRVLFVCDSSANTAGIPAWMTDRAVCAALSHGPAMVHVEALSELAQLLDTRRSPDEGSSKSRAGE